MAKYDKLQVLATMTETGMVPVFYHADAEVAKKVLKACYDGRSNSPIAETSRRKSSANWSNTQTRSSPA